MTLTKKWSVSVSVSPNSLYYNILYVNTLETLGKGGKTLFWRIVYFEGYKIYYILY